MNDLNGQIRIDARKYAVCFSHAIDISIPIRGTGEGVLAFGAGHPQISALEVGSYVGDVRRGGSCNCSTVSITPHCHGTHTESMGHITSEPIFVTEVLPATFFVAQLITIMPQLTPGADRIITREAVQRAFSLSMSSNALIIRTLPNSDKKLSMNYTGTNPPYLDFAAAVFIAEKGIQHLLVDTPSLDREDDGGKLAAHRSFWSKGRERCTVTELVYIREEIVDGFYLLDLQVAPILSDAAPSRPMLFPIELA